MVRNEVIGDLSSKKGGTLSFHDSKLSKSRAKINQICKFLKFLQIPAENSVIPGELLNPPFGWWIPGNSRRGIPRGPDRNEKRKLTSGK